MSNYSYRVGELRPLSLRSECQAAVSTPVKATGTDDATLLSVVAL